MVGINNQKTLTLIIFGTICFIFLWTFAPTENYVKDDHIISDITDISSDIPEGYDRYYANYLDTFRQQHYQMLSILIRKANRALKNNSIYSVTLKSQLAPS